jgi:hypothetical protein
MTPQRTSDHRPRAPGSPLNGRNFRIAKHRMAF